MRRFRVVEDDAPSLPVEEARGKIEAVWRGVHDDLTKALAELSTATSIYHRRRTAFTLPDVIALRREADKLATTTRGIVKKLDTAIALRERVKR